LVPIESSYTTSLGVLIVEWLSHSTVLQEIPGSNPGAAEKCWAVMELFVNIYLYEFVLSLVCVRVRCFGLYLLSYGIDKRTFLLLLLLLLLFLLVNNTNLHPILHSFKLWLIIGQIFASESGVPHFNTLAGGDPC